MSYLQQILYKYKARDLSGYVTSITQLKTTLKTWASTCYVDILDSGSRAKGTAISLASDVDFLVSLTSGCNENSGGLRSIYNSLFNKLNGIYLNVRKQNVSVRITINSLEVDVTPARRQDGYSDDHWLYVSKLDTRTQSNINKHIQDISQSGRLNEIKLIKIWRELNRLDFPSIYLEYIIKDYILKNYPTNISNLGDNTFRILKELGKSYDNPLDIRIVDPANSNNILSDLLNQTEKKRIIDSASIASQQTNWNQILW